MTARRAYQLARRLDRLKRRPMADMLGFFVIYDRWKATFEELHGPDCWRLVGAGVPLYEGEP